jgi:hypothetical protein
VLLVFTWCASTPGVLASMDIPVREHSKYIAKLKKEKVTK